MFNNIEDEIEVLESALSNLESAIGDVRDTPYHSYLAQNWELDAEEIKARLEELYEIQNNYWAKELKALNFDYERMIL